MRHFLGCCGGGDRLDGTGMKNNHLDHHSDAGRMRQNRYSYRRKLCQCLTRYVDSENSVICYQALYQSSTAISCVQLDREVRDASK